MRSIRTTLVLAAIFGFAGGSAMADDEYSFDVADGNWNVPGNWEPPGPPGPGDTAIISGDRHCHVESDDQQCEILQVVNGGILTIEAPYSLKIGDGGTETISSISGGTIYFLKETQEGFPELLINTGGVELSALANGGGTLNASKGDGYGPGRIGIASGGSQVLEVCDDVTVKGHLWIYVHVKNNGTFEVDDPNDAMIFNGYGACSMPQVTGYESFDVSAGTLTFDDCLLPVDNTTAWNLSGTGTIHVTDECLLGFVPYQYYTGCAIDISGGELWVERPDPPFWPIFKTTGAFNMSGGTLDADGAFKVTGGAQISGGTIEVAPGKSAEFRHPQ